MIERSCHEQPFNGLRLTRSRCSVIGMLQERSGMSFVCEARETLTWTGKLAYECVSKSSIMLAPSGCQSINSVIRSRRTLWSA